MRLEALEARQLLAGAEQVTRIELWDGAEPTELGVFNNELYFQARTEATGRELWKLTAAGTASLVADINPGAGDSCPQDLTVFNNELYFQAESATSGEEIWKLNAAGKVSQVTQIDGSIGNPCTDDFTVFNNALYFGVHRLVYNELWKLNAAGEASLVIDFHDDLGGSSPAGLTEFNNELYFVAPLFPGGPQIRKVNAAGTVSTVVEFSDGFGSLWPPAYLTVFNNELYFQAYTPTTGSELWKVSASGVSSLVADINPGAGNSSPANLKAFGGALYFQAEEPTYGNELWTVDTWGTASRVTDVARGFGCSFPEHLTIFQNELYFQAAPGLWKLSESGSLSLVSDRGNLFADPEWLTVLGQDLYFTDIPAGIFPDLDRTIWKLSAAAPPDLRITSATFEGSSTLAVTYGVTGAASPFEIGWYRSTDAAFGAGDVLLDRVTINSPTDLAIGTHTKRFTIGAGSGQIALPGAGAAETGDDYHLLAVADPANQVPEADADPTNEDNTAVLHGAYQGGTTVFVHGTPAADRITLAASGTNLTVAINGTTRSFPAAGATGLRVRAHAGADTVTGTTLARPIWMWGGPGNDVLQGGTADDTYDFDCDTSLGRDTIADADGTDTLSFSATTSRSIAIDLAVLGAAQTVNANLAITLAAGTTLENVLGGSLNDTLKGNAAANRLTGGPGNDTLLGRGGNDTYLFDCDTALGIDRVDESSAAGGGGNDTLSFAATTSQAVTLYLARLGAAQAVNPNLTLILVAGTSIENVVGGAKDDLLVGNGLANVLIGNAGNNILLGAGGNDTLKGGAGRDLLIGGSGWDRLYGAAGDDLLLGGTTAYYTEATGALNRTALNAILLEWKSAAAYSVRVGHLRSGGGLNGNYRLNSTTAGNDGAVDALFGEGNDDWFLASASDTRDADPVRETVVPI